MEESDLSAILHCCPTNFGDVDIGCAGTIYDAGGNKRGNKTVKREKKNDYNQTVCVHGTEIRPYLLGDPAYP